jgi:hypothetical protein
MHELVRRELHLIQSPEMMYGMIIKVNLSLYPMQAPRGLGGIASTNS